MSTKKVATDRRGLPLVSVRLQQQAQRHKRSVAQIPRWRRPFTGYVLSIPLVGVTSLGVLWVQHLFPHFSFFDGPLLLAVMVMAMIWGIGPAIFSALVSTAALAYLYIPVSSEPGCYHLERSLADCTFLPFQCDHCCRYRPA